MRDLEYAIKAVRKLHMQFMRYEKSLSTTSKELSARINLVRGLLVYVVKFIETGDPDELPERLWVFLEPRAAVIDLAANERIAAELKNMTKPWPYPSSQQEPMGEEE